MVKGLSGVNSSVEGHQVSVRISPEQLECIIGITILDNALSDKMEGTAMTVGDTIRRALSVYVDYRMHDPDLSNQVEVAKIELFGGSLYSPPTEGGDSVGD